MDLILAQSEQSRIKLDGQGRAISVYIGSWRRLTGGYAIVGAAAFSAGVTHSISICIVICEMTGHIRHIIPVMIAVLVSNALSSLLQPSYYDSIILIKKLPYLPSIASSTSGNKLISLCSTLF